MVEHEAGARTDARISVGAARWSLVGLFAVNGLTFGAWISRIPAIREAVGLTPGQLGLILLAGNLAGIPTMILAPRIVAMIGQANAVRLCGALFGAGYLVMGLACSSGSALVLVVGLLVHWTAWMLYGFTTDVASTVVERRLERPVIAQFHVGFGIGMILGSLAGAGAAAQGVSLLASFSVMAVVAVLWRLAGARTMLVDDQAVEPRPLRFRWRRHSTDTDTAPDSGADALGVYGLSDAWRDPRALVIGAVMLAVGALTLTRRASAYVLVRLGRVRTLRGGAILAISGILIFVLSPTFPAALVGAAAWGAGSALSIPVAVSATSDDPPRTANRIVVMSAFGLIPLVILPPSIGAIADVVGVRHALLVVAAVLTVIVAAARRLAPRPVDRAPEPVSEPQATTA